MESQLPSQYKPTSLANYLKNCHSHFTMGFRAQDDPSLTTKGLQTNPRGRKCPKKIRPWSDFPTTQSASYAFISNAFEQERIFPTLDIVREFATEANGKKVGSEKQLEINQRLALESPVERILKEFAKRRDKALYAINIAADPLGLPEPELGRRTDRTCIYMPDDGISRIAVVLEYKPPHKASLPMINKGLEVKNPRKELIDKPYIPNDPDAKADYGAKAFIGAAITQTYDYMLEGNTRFGCIITGQALIFLQIGEGNDLGSVYWHLSIPQRDVQDVDTDASLTAIAQLTSFCFHAMQNPQEDSLWQKSASEYESRWTEDLNQMLKNMSEDEQPTPPPSNYISHARKSVNLNLGNRRNPKRNKPNSQSCVDHNNLGSGSSTSDDESDPSHEDSPTRRKTPSPIQQVPAASKESKAAASTSSSKNNNQNRPYCTQKCLLGLMDSGEVDSNCPNLAYHLTEHVACHRAEYRYIYHFLDAGEFLGLLTAQLKNDINNNCRLIPDKKGAVGALFKVSLENYNYTFVAKSSIAYYMPKLKHEHQIYDTLYDLQGSFIPVCLGAIEFERPWVGFGIDTALKYMLLMSWGGEEAFGDKAMCADEKAVRDSQAKETVREIRSAGVRQGDNYQHKRNMLWCEELGRVFLIDFERARLVEQKPREAEAAKNEARSASGQGDIEPVLAEEQGKLKKTESEAAENEVEGSSGQGKMGLVLAENMGDRKKREREDEGEDEEEEQGWQKRKILPPSVST